MTYDPYAQYSNNYSTYQPTAPFETEEEKKKEEEQKAILERIQTNRLYLKKVRKECAAESFEDLQNLHLFLFEVSIEALEVSGGSDLGLITDKKDLTYVTARVRFLNSPYLEICEKDVILEDPDVQTDYFKAVSQGGLANTYYSGSPPKSSTEEPVLRPPTEEELKAETNKVKWTKTSGKSCLFSLTPLQVVQDLEQYPVVVQVVRRLLADTNQGKVSSKTQIEQEKERSKLERDNDLEKTKLEQNWSLKDKKCVVEDKNDKYEPLGYARIKLPEEFCLSVLQACKEGVLLPVSNVHRETCDLENVFGTKKGTISICIRLSSFGPAIVTNFHTVGTETRYSFKPSAIVDNFQTVRKITDSFLDDLKPLIAEEDKIVGISVMKTEDTTFKKQVLWKTGRLGGCTFEEECLYPTPTMFTEMTPMVLPISSNLSLCRDVIRPKNFQRKRFSTAGNICHWHNLVTEEIINGPREACGCVPKLCKPSAKRTVDIHDTKHLLKRKPRGVCTCSASPVQHHLISLKECSSSKPVDNPYKNLGHCFCIPGMKRTPYGQEKPNKKEKCPLYSSNDGKEKSQNKKCCEFCRCCSSPNDTKKKPSTSEKSLLGFSDWPSPRYLVKKDPFGREEPEIKKVRELLEDADKMLEDDLKDRRTEKFDRGKSGCVPIYTKPKSTNENGKPKKCECCCKRPKCLFIPESPCRCAPCSEMQLMKMKRLCEDLPPITGFGLKPMETDCGCICPDIKRALQCKTLFPF